MLLPRPEILLLIVMVFVPLERLFALHREQGVLRRLWQLDTIYMLINPLFVGLGLNAVVFCAVLLGAWLVPAPVQSWAGSQPLWLQFPALLVLSDLGFYGVHRLFHTVPWLWRFHAVHHSIEEMDWLAAHRVHPVDQILTKGASLIPVFALGFSPVAIAAYAVLYQWQSLLIHSNVKIEFGPLARIFASPRFHHWHHANHPEAYNRNYAGQLAFLDYLFGTMHMPKTAMPEHYGSSMPVPENYGAQLVFPFLKDTAAAPDAAVASSDSGSATLSPG